MRNKLHDAELAVVCLIISAFLPFCTVSAQDLLDEDSLFAQEELTLDEAVEGSLSATGSDDDFLNDLFGDGGGGLPEDIAVPVDDLPLDALFEEPVEEIDQSAGEALPAGLDEVVDDIRAEPMSETDEFPLDAGYDADAVLGEMLDMGDLDVTAEEFEDADIADDEREQEEDGGDIDFDAMLGEMLGEEPAAEAAPSEDVAEEKGLAVEQAEDDLGFLFADEVPAEVAEPVVEAADLDMDALMGELGAEPDADVDDLGLTEDLELPGLLEGEPAPEPVALPVEIAADPPAPEPVAAVPDPVPVEADDPLALEDDFFSDLVREAKEDVKVSPFAAAPAGVPAPEVAVDPFAGRPEDLGGVAPAGVEPAAASLPAVAEEWAGAEPAEVLEAGQPQRPQGLAAFEEAERLKRQAQEFHSKNTLDGAQQALAQKDYLRAIRLFEEARRYMPRRPDTEPWLAQLRRGLAESYYQQALSLERMNEYESARAAALNAVRNGHPRAEALVAALKTKIDAPPPPPPPPPRVRWDEPEYQTQQSQIRNWLRQGRQAYLVGEYDQAIIALESVLARDPENKEAIRLMHSAANKQYDRSTMELNATAARMMASVRDTWNPRQYGLHERPLRDDRPDGTTIQGDELQRMAILAKMQTIRIPEVDFRQANIRDVVNFLFQQSAEFDPDPVPANRKGVNIILKLDSDASGGRAAPAPMAMPSDPFAPAAPAFGGGGGAAGGLAETLVTFNARDVTLKEALDIVVDIAGLKYLIRGNVVMVMPRDAAVGEIEHRMYDVLPSAITRLQELSSAVSGGGGGGAARRGGAGDFLSLEPTGGMGGEDVDLKGFFQEMGVEWPNRSSIKFVRGLGKLVVANTLENLAVFEKVLSILNVVPYQIEIEARFIEVAQTDVDSLGLEWLLNDSWEIAQKKGSAGTPLGARERIQMNANASQGGFTTGNRFLSGTGLQGPSGAAIMDQVASISSVLTNPELTMVLHALQQRGHTDLLSAPKITTQSGQQAVIKVVTEYIYPTEFETSGIGGDAGGAAGGGAAGGGVVGAVVTPRDFTTREVGVILEVLPEVSPEGQMINLTLSPEVVSEPTWRNYGSTYTSYDPNGNPIVQSLNMEQPFFHTRKLQTNLLIYNGATVVMGGMITEVRTNVDDRIPLLGDIPLLGRLFRSKYESSEKRNLLIFVTARLVDPAGRALDRDALTTDRGIAERIAIGPEGDR